MRSINTPPRNGTKSPGKVMTITCPLTFTVECVAARMYQLTPAKFIPLPKSDTNMARKKKRKPRCAQISFQSTVFVVAVAMEHISLLSWGPSTGDAHRRRVTFPEQIGRKRGEPPWETKRIARYNLASSGRKGRLCSKRAKFSFAASSG